MLVINFILLNRKPITHFLYRDFKNSLKLTLNTKKQFYFIPFYDLHF